MGMTHVDIVVANPAEPDSRVPIRFLVDSGATYSVVPADLLARLGIGEAGDSNLLGAFTLGALGLSFDPLKRELNELPMLL